MTRSERRRGWGWLTLAATVWVWVWFWAGSGSPGQAEDDDGAFGFSAPIACRDVKGYEDYEPLPDATLTRDEKLIVYFLPRHYKSALKAKKYEAHFTLEGRIRRRGQKAVIWTLDKTLDYKISSRKPPEQVYITNKIALKSLEPGDYDYDITLRDAVGKSAPVVRTLRFTIVPPSGTETPAEK